MIRTYNFAIGLSLSALLAASPSYAKVKVGAPAPAWSSLVGIDGKDHALAQYQKSKALVIVFTCNHCPVAKAYEDRLIELQKDYEPKGVQVIAINVNNIAADRLDKMKERAKEKGFNFPYLYDTTQVSGHDYGARVTPHAFVLDGARKIAYMGAIDDSQALDNVKVRYVRDALDAILAGSPPPKTETKAFGCGIKYENKEGSK
jgi:thiol-disulfide isomerase/thioredoxin